MNITAKLTYRFELSARELNLIRRALEKMENPDASDLARRITNQANKGNETIRAHFESILTVEAKGGAE